MSYRSYFSDLVQVRQPGRMIFFTPTAGVALRLVDFVPQGEAT